MFTQHDIDHLDGADYWRFRLFTEGKIRKSEDCSWRCGNCGRYKGHIYFRFAFFIRFCYIYLKCAVFLKMLIYDRNFHNNLMHLYIWWPFYVLMYQLIQQIMDQKGFKQDFKFQQNVNILLYVILIYQMLLDAYKSIKYSKLILLVV